MVSLATRIIDRSFNINEGSAIFLKRLIIGLVIVGVLFGILGCYLSKLVWLVEVLIVPTLTRAIVTYRSVNRDSVGLLNEATRTLEGARKQIEIEDRIRRRKANE